MKVSTSMLVVVLVVASHTYLAFTAHSAAGSITMYEENGNASSSATTYVLLTKGVPVVDCARKSRKADMCMS